MKYIVIKKKKFGPGPLSPHLGPSLDSSMIGQSTANQNLALTD